MGQNLVSIFLGTVYFVVWVTVWVRQLTRILTHTIFGVFAAKKHRKPKLSMLFGAGGVTRTPDLLITKCIGVLRLAVFRAFGAFPLGILREVRPILSIVFVRSFPRVGHGVGQSAFRTQTKGAPPTAVTLTSALCPAHR